ncbi:hypothetical protein [Cryomorpha ignava]|nr:hypothetical protein [Cryomorpha ignava]
MNKVSFRNSEINPLLQQVLIGSQHHLSYNNIDFRIIKWDIISETI